MKEGYVLYVDHAQHPAPLSLCYHPTGARHLSSTVDRFPPSSLREVDSAYCPHCLSYHDASSAARMGFCNKPSCAQCPICQNTCSVTLNSELLYYQCGACDWTSQECNVTLQLPDHAENLGRLEYARALEELGSVLKQRRTSEEVYNDAWKTLSRAWEKRVQGTKLAAASQHELRLSRDLSEEWSVETLEASIKKRKQALADNDEDNLASKLDLPIQRMSLDAAAPQTQLHENMNDISTAAVQLQLLNRPDPITSRSDMLPLPIPLRPRISLRCRAELDRGRPGILLKPKLNPLEGDTSLRSGHGQWFKKDSSAIQVIPRVRVIDFDVTAKRSAFLLKVTNPTLGALQLRFVSSNYQGEYCWDMNSADRQTIMRDLMVDELKQTHLNVDLQTNVLHDLASTEVVELLSSEDSFIEFGGKSREIPTEIREWKAPVGEISSPQMRLVASSSSTAWFELLTSGIVSSSENNNLHPGIPISLEVKVGGGSWESSLIAETKEDDFVAFDLVITWP